MQKKAFTLVELIVVITILAVLSTIWFISLSGYSVTSRDTVRITDLKNIQNALNLVIIQDKSIPDGSDMVEITASWSHLFYQWTLSSQELWNIWIQSWGFDPLTWSGIIYARNNSKNKFQLGVFLENQESLAQSIWWVYADNSNKFFHVAGNKLWIILEEDTQWVPQIDIDIFQVTKNYSSYLDNWEILSWTWATLWRILPNGDCKRIYDSVSKVSWIYEIFSLSSVNGVKNVYCDFTYPQYIVSDELIQTWDFIDGQKINTEVPEWSVWNNTIIEMQSPMDSWYVLHQTGDGKSEYEIHLNVPLDCTEWKQITMRSWISRNAKSSQERISHNRLYDTQGSHYYLNNSAYPSVEIIDTKNINWRQWSLEQIQWITTRDISKMDWYLWFDSEVVQSDMFITWVRLWCH